MTSTVKGITVWVTRDREACGTYYVWEKKPLYKRETWDVRLGAYITRVCDSNFKKYLGVSPSAKLKKGGPTAIMKATLYCALEWDE